MRKIEQETLGDKKEEEPGGVQPREYRSPLRDTIDRMPTPRDVTGVFALFLALDAADVDEGRITAEEFHKSQDLIIKTIKDAANRPQVDKNSEE